MSSYRSLAHLMATLADTAGYSKHKVARAQRFIFRHRKAHRRIIGELVEAQREHEVAQDRLFLAARRSALAAFNAEKSKRKKSAA